MEPLTALPVSADRLIELAAGIRPSDWERPTPCEGWTVRTLVGHLLACMRGYADLLHGGQAAGLTALLDRQDSLAGDDPAREITAAAAVIGAAFAEPGALERTVHHPSGDLPGSRLLVMRLTDNVVHGWDLATALGLPADIDPDLAELLYEVLAPRADALAASGYFRPPRRAVSPDAPPQERLITLLGR
jgi:uncharacterized protein (TIGR03086 family)